MVQPEDNRTLPLPLSGVTEKRGRGRPRKVGGAMTNAQRQAAYRARHKGQHKAVSVTKNGPVAVDAYDALVLESDRLREELAAVRAELAGERKKHAALRLAMRRPVGNRWSYRQVTAAAEAEIGRFGARLAGCAVDEVWAQTFFRGAAQGAHSLWYALTCGWQGDGDHERLTALVDAVTRNDKSGV